VEGEVSNWQIESILHCVFSSCRDRQGKVPYEMASKVECRNSFRKFMAVHPNLYNYDLAKVGLLELGYELCVLKLNIRQDQNSQCVHVFLVSKDTQSFDG